MMKLQIILLVIVSQLRAVVQHKPTNNEHQMRHNRFDISRNDAITTTTTAISMDEHYQQPYFDTNDPTVSPNTMSLVEGEDAYLVCVVRNLGSNSISWLRHNDINLLSVGKFMYTQDPRYQIFHNSPDTWTMKIQRVKAKDSGLYECQIGISNSQPIGRMIYLKVIEPQVSILQGNEMLIGVGSNLNLTCFIKQTQDPYQSVADDDDDDDGDGNEWGRRRSSLRWSHNGEELNHHSPRGIFLSVTTQDEASISYLIIKNMIQSDEGTYRCFISSDIYASIVVHVESDQSMETKKESSKNNAHKLQQSKATFATTVMIMVMMASLRLSY